MKKELNNNLWIEEQLENFLKNKTEQMALTGEMVIKSTAKLCSNVNKLIIRNMTVDERSAQHIWAV